MNKLANSSAEPSYISRLALNASPFSSSGNTDSFFNSEQIEQRLNLLFHLVRSSDKVGLLFAEQGVGKSTLITQLQQGAGDELRIVRIDAQSSADSSSLILQCLRAFGVEEEGGSENDEYKAHLKNRLKRLRDLNIRPLLLVDDSDSLAPDNLAIFKEWLSWQDDEGFLLQAIFTASRVMPELENIDGRLQRVDLPGLTEQELSAYLMQRLVSVGFQGELPFSPKEIKKFYQQSLGNPAAVNQLAHQKLLGIKSSSASTVMIKPIALLRWLGVTILVISFIMLLVFQDKINIFFSSGEKQSSTIEQPIVFNSQDELVTTIVVGDEKEISAEQAERDELAILVAELPVVEDKEIEVNKEQAETLNEELLDDVEPVVLSPVHQQDWIKQQRSTDYTFQLMGSWQHEEVLAFIDKHTLIGDVAEFQSERNGRTWYALVYGVYESKQIALQESSNWPAPLNTLPSWLRRFDSVQKQIKSGPQEQ